MTQPEAGHLSEIHQSQTGNSFPSNGSFQKNNAAAIKKKKIKDDPK